MTTARRRYMARLRAERAEVMAQRRPVVDPGRHPHLHALAQALRAIPSHRRKFFHGPMRFRIAHGMTYRGALDPDTGELLVTVLDI